MVTIIAREGVLSMTDLFSYLLPYPASVLRSDSDPKLNLQRLSFVRTLIPNLTFRLDESTTTTTLPPPVPRSTRPLRRNSTTLVKHNLLLSINIRHPHRLIGHGDINKTISQLLVDPLTPCLQRSPTKHHLRRASSSRRPLIIVTNNQKIAPAPRFSGVQN